MENIRINENEKSVIITGITGFLGSHMAFRFVKEGYSVIGIKRKKSDLWRLEGFIDKLTLIDYDSDSFLDSLSKTGPSFLIHCATDYGDGDTKVSQILKSNIFFPIAILEAIKPSVFINTDTFITPEIGLPGNINFYVLSKKHFLDYVKIFCKDNLIKLVNIKLYHVYGPKENPNRFVNSIINRLISGIKKIDMTLGEQKRDFVYVNDAVDAYVLIVKSSDKLPDFSNFDLGYGKTVTINEVSKTIKKLLNSDAELNFGGLSYRKNENMYSCADISELSKLGWSPRYDLESGLNETIKYYQKMV